MVIKLWRQINIKKSNIYDLSGEYGIGYCSNTGNPFYFDLEDYDKIKDYCWIEYIRNGYHSLEAWNIGVGGNITMNWVIAGKYHDHINRNPLDNRKSNLRPCNLYQNAMNSSIMSNNTSGIIGVNWNKKIQKWLVRIQYYGKRISLGYFSNKEDAIRARLKAELKYFGEFAPQKDLFAQYNIKENQNEHRDKAENY